MIFDTAFVSLPVNHAGRDFVVGDVHGQGALLESLLKVVDFNQNSDRLIALGDLVDRGPDSEALLCKVRDQPWFLSLRGNHEAMLLESLSSYEVRSIWARNQSEWAWGLSAERLESLAQIVAGLPLAFELPLPDGRVIGLVHAEVARADGWDEVRKLVPEHRDAVDDSAFTPSASLIWGRRRIRSWARMRTAKGRSKLDADRYVESWECLQPVAGIDQVISGHTVLAQPRPAAVTNLLFIETGAFLPEGRLTLVEPLARQYWQARYVGDKASVLRRKPTPLPAPMQVQERWRPTPEIIEEARAIRSDELSQLRNFFR